MVRRITIAGDIGSGKTTVAKRLAGIMEVDPLSIGSIQRQLAESRGISTLELNKLAEKDPSVDKYLDSYQKGLTSGDLLVDARLGWYFVPNTLKVYLYISDYAAAKRVLGANRADELYDASTALKKIYMRRRSEVARFKKEYSVDIGDLTNYDLVIDTTLASIDEVVRKIHKYMDGQRLRTSCYICPKNMIPTQSIRDTSQERTSRIEQDIIKNGYAVVEHVSAVYVDHVFYIVDGHARVAASIKNELTFVPVEIEATDDEPFRAGISARQYVRDSVSDSRIYDWEAALEFRFEYPVWRSSPEEADQMGYRPTGTSR